MAQAPTTPSRSTTQHSTNNIRPFHRLTSIRYINSLTTPQINHQTIPPRPTSPTTITIHSPQTMPTDHSNRPNPQYPYDQHPPKPMHTMAPWLAYRWNTETMQLWCNDFQNTLSNANTTGLASPSTPQQLPIPSPSSSTEYHDNHQHHLEQETDGIDPGLSLLPYY